MPNKSVIENYLKKVNLENLLEKLEASNTNIILKNIEYFTEKEAEKRDKILLNYFGEEGLKRIIDTIIDHLLSSPKLRADAKILDVGAGTGYFTIKIANRLHQHFPQASFYAMDITPTMLSILAEKADYIIPFLGVAENIASSIRFARRYVEVPDKFDAIFSTLMLHHCINVERVFKSIKDVLKNNGKAVIVDLCEHSFKEFREEMGDIHLGFNPSSIEKLAKPFFKDVYVKRIAGISCSCSGRSADLFIAYLIP